MRPHRISARWGLVLFVLEVEREAVWRKGLGSQGNVVAVRPRGRRRRSIPASRTWQDPLLGPLVVCHFIDLEVGPRRDVTVGGRTTFDASAALEAASAGANRAPGRA